MYGVWDRPCDLRIFPHSAFHHLPPPAVIKLWLSFCAGGDPFQRDAVWRQLGVVEVPSADIQADGILARARGVECKRERVQNDPAARAACAVQRVEDRLRRRIADLRRDLFPIGRRPQLCRKQRGAGQRTDDAVGFQSRSKLKREDRLYRVASECIRMNRGDPRIIASKRKQPLFDPQHIFPRTARAQDPIRLHACVPSSHAVLKHAKKALPRQGRSWESLSVFWHKSGIFVLLRGILSEYAGFLDQRLLSV